MAVGKRLRKHVPTPEEFVALQAAVSANRAILDDLHREASHRSYIFPDMSSNIDLTCQFKSGAIDEFGAWVEITDSGATTLSSIAAAHALHISALRIRSNSATNLMYVIEIGYGPNAGAVTILDPHEFGSGDKHIDSDEQMRFRPPVIPLGQKVWYRMKTENTLNATANIELRYHYDD